MIPRAAAYVLSGAVAHHSVHWCLSMSVASGNDRKTNNAHSSSSSSLESAVRAFFSSCVTSLSLDTLEDLRGESR